MSVYSAKTGLSSILKCYSPDEREKTKNVVINKVRFVEPRGKGLAEAIKDVLEKDNFMPLAEYASYLTECHLNDADFIRIINEVHSIVHVLSPKFTLLAETLLSMQWTNRSTEAVQKYMDFFVDLLVAQSKYISFAISKLIVLWIPKDTDSLLWLNGTPNEQLRKQLQAIHTLLDRIVPIMPISFHVIIDNIASSFPYYKKPAHVVSGFVHNMLWLLEYKPMFTEYIMQLLLQKLVVLDVNAPRNELEDAEFEDDMDEEDNDDEEMFKMDDATRTERTTEVMPMNHPIAHTLDLCMEKIFIFLGRFNPNVLSDADTEKEQPTLAQALQFLKILQQAFNNAILPSHNTNHVQFLIFYYCSFKNVLAESFLEFLWDKITDLNESAVIRQAAVGYMASFLARSKILPLPILKNCLKELSDWAHQYIQRCDQYRSNGSLKANLVFFSVCQAIFYVIAFRSKDLTMNKKGLLFLQSLQLSALVTCNFNPLRVCLPAVATAFAGVTRAYQLAYCHAILERNARRKLATVYANDTSTPEEVLDTFFPFDPYLLKLSSKHITSDYLQYQANEAEEEPSSVDHSTANVKCLKRNDSEMVDDIDDFLIADKRQKLNDLARSNEAQFTYGLSPGFHI